MFKRRKNAIFDNEGIGWIGNKKDIGVVEYIDQWGSLTGNGESFIIFKIHPTQLAEIRDSCKTKGFKALPIKETVPDNFINNYIGTSDTIGYYWLDINKTDKRNYCIVVLNEVTNKLIVYNVVN